MRVIALLSAVLFVLSSPCARADYLNTPDAFAAGWAALLSRLPDDPEVMHIEIVSDAIVAVIRTGPGSAQIDQFTVIPAVTKQGPGHRVDGPTPSSSDFGRVFRLPDMLLPDRIEAVMVTARAALKLGPEAEFVYLLAGHMPIDDSGPGVLSLIVEIESPLVEGTVQLTPDAQILHVALRPITASQALNPGRAPVAETAPALPPAEAPTAAPSVPATPVIPAGFRGDSGRDLLAGLSSFAAHLGPDTLIWEIDARPDRITIDRPHPTEPGTVAILTLTAQGFRDERTFPRMMQTEADLFALSAVMTLTAETIEAARTAGLAAVAIPGGELERLRLWSGAPFWRHPAREPFFDIRVGTPPNGQPNGYAVVTLDGQVVQAFR